MHNIQIQGFSELQREIADRLWQLDDQADMERFLLSLPRNLRREAVMVSHMIIATELDSYMEVSPDVQAYLSSL